MQDFTDSAFVCSLPVVPPCERRCDGDVIACSIPPDQLSVHSSSSSKCQRSKRRRIKTTLTRGNQPNKRLTQFVIGLSRMRNFRINGGSVLVWCVLWWLTVIRLIIISCLSRDLSARDCCRVSAFMTLWECLHFGGSPCGEEARQA